MKKEDKDFLILEIAKSNLIKKDGIIYADDLKKFIDQLEEPELPVIPLFVAEVIDKYKEHDDSLGELLASVEHANIKYYHNMEKYRVDFDNLYKPGVDLCAIIARAWINGYTIEKEKRYHVYDKATKSYLGYNAVRTQLNWWTSRLENESFTEQEIKNIDERYWAFAEEV